MKGIHQYQRRNTIIVSGVPQKENDDVYGVLELTGEAAKVSIKEDVSIAHRLPVNHPT